MEMQSSNSSALMVQEPIAIAMPAIASMESILALKEMCKIVAYSSLLKSNSRDIAQRTADAFFIARSGLELGVPSMTAFRHMYAVDGKIGVETVLLLAIVRKAKVELVFPDFASIKDSATVKIRRPGGEWREYTYTMEMAKKAGLTGKWNWQKNQAEMLCWRAAGLAMKYETPDITGGLYTVEEIAPDTMVDDNGAPIGEIVITKPESAPPATVSIVGDMPSGEFVPDESPVGKIIQDELPPATSNGHKEPEPNGKVHEKAEDKQEWPNAGAINHVIKYSCQQLSITEADVARYLDIKELADVESWKKFTNGGEAMKAIKAGFDADTEALAKLPPAQPKTSPFGGTAETAKRHEWTDKDRADMDALCARFWDEELVAPLLPDKFFADTDHVAWSAFPSIAAARAALIAYARKHTMPIIVSSAEHAAKHKYTIFSNDLLQVTLYSRDKLRKLGVDWAEYVDKDWSEAGDRYQFSRKGLPDLIVYWQSKTAKDGHEYLDCVDVAEVESESTPD